MSASAISLHEFIEAFRQEVEALAIHPCVAIAGRTWAMHDAVERGDLASFAYLLRQAQAKVSDELEWEEDKERSAIDPSYIPRCCRG